MPSRLLEAIDFCGPTTFCGVQITNVVAGTVAVFAPAALIQGGTGNVDAAANSDFVWLWRGLITLSLMLNLFFLQTVYKKLKRIGPHNRAISTLHVAVEFLAREANEHGAKRQADHLVFTMLREVDKLVKEEDD